MTCIGHGKWSCHGEKLNNPTAGRNMDRNPDTPTFRGGEEKAIFTLGTSNRSIQEFIEILKACGVRQVIDVRRFPTSHFDHCKKENLSKAAEHAGLRYGYVGDRLGGFRSGGYEAHMKTETFQDAILEVERLARKEPTVILCAEKIPWKCHRRFIGAALRMRGWRVIHILDKDRTYQLQEQLDLLKS
jgi:uncharacterized protein (DUF488 family)